ncbi:MAG: hypothetical protein ABIT05_12660 [Chitinophagaceae bacterium]
MELKPTSRRKAPHLGIYVRKHLKDNNLNALELAEKVYSFCDTNLKELHEELVKGKQKSTPTQRLFEKIGDFSEINFYRKTNNTLYNRILSCYLLHHEHLISNISEIRDLQKDSIDIYISTKSKRKFLFYYWKRKVRVGYLEFVFDIEGNLKEITLEHLDEKFKMKSQGKSNSIHFDIIAKNVCTTLRHADIITQMIIPVEGNFKFSPITFCTYSMNNSKSILASGTGILERINDFPSKVKILETQINPLISNNLYLRREELEENEVRTKSLEKFKNIKEIEYFKSLKGRWIGSYMRNDKSFDSEDSGGIEFVELEIQADGTMRLLSPDFIDGKQIVAFEGFGSFPGFENKNFLKANFGISDEGKIFSIHLFLESENGKLKGVISGWNLAFKPFSGVIIFEQIKGKKEFKKRIAKEEIIFKTNSGEVLNKELFDFFQNENKYLNLPQDCLPINYSNYQFDELVLAGLLKGNYFLFSYNKDEGTIIKLKTVITSEGCVSIYYGDIQYNGVALYKKFGNNSEGYLILDLYETKINKKKEKFWGYYLFQVGQLISFKKEGHYDNANFIPGISLRVNTNGEPQSKKEYLLPVENDVKFSEHNKFEFNYIEDKIRDIRGSDDPSIFQSLKYFMLSLKGRTDNILKVPFGSVNNFETSRSHRRTEYHEIFFNCFLMYCAFADPRKENLKMKSREYFVEAILHGLDITTINNSLNIFYERFSTSSKTKSKIELTCLSIANIVQTFNKKGKNDALKNIILLKETPVSKDAITLSDHISELIQLLNQIAPNPLH